MARNVTNKKLGQLVKIDAVGILTRELNTQLREVVTNGTKKIELRNVFGQRYIGTDLGKPVEIEIFGTPAMTWGHSWMDPELSYEATLRTAAETP